MHPNSMDIARRSRIPVSDPATGAPLEVFADPNVLWSSGSIWRGVIAEAYRFEDVDTPEFQVPGNHNLVLHLSAPAHIEQRINGVWDMRVRVPGDLSVFPETTARQIKASTSHEVLVVSLSEGMLAQSVPELRGTPIFELHPIAYLRDTRLEHICRALKAEAEADYVSGSLYGEWLGLALGARLAHLHSAGASLAFKRGGIAPRTLARVIDFIDSNLDSPLRMSALAEVAGLSEYRFAHNFKSAIGFAPHQYVMRARLERAKRLLRETDSSVLEIACEVGCPNLSRFNSLFRRETGTLPTIYRASFRQLRKA